MVAVLSSGLGVWTCVNEDAISLEFQSLCHSRLPSLTVPNYNHWQTITSFLFPLGLRYILLVHQLPQLTKTEGDSRNGEQADDFDTSVLMPYGIPEHLRPCLAGAVCLLAISGRQGAHRRSGLTVCFPSFAFANDAKRANGNARRATQ